MRVPATRRTHSVSPGQTASVCRPGPRPPEGRRESRSHLMKGIALTASGECHLLSANALPDAAPGLKPTSERCRTPLPEFPPPASRTPPLVRSGPCQVGCHSLAPDQKHFITYRPLPVKAFRHISGPPGRAGRFAAPRRGAGGPPGRDREWAPRRPGTGGQSGPGPPGGCRRRALAVPQAGLLPARPDNRDCPCSSQVASAPSAAARQARTPLFRREGTLAPRREMSSLFAELAPDRIGGRVSPHDTFARGPTGRVPWLRSRSHVFFGPGSTFALSGWQRAAGTRPHIGMWFARPLVVTPSGVFCHAVTSTLPTNCRSSVRGTAG
jgi:hypothetical protein